MAIWRFYKAQDTGDTPCDDSIEVTRLTVPGSPVFSLAKIPDVLPDGTVARRKPSGKPSGIYLGTAKKEVLTWMLGSKDVTNKVVLGGHTGWVRALAVTGKWLFSCGCNCLRLWDTTFRTPKESEAVKLFTGDILAIAASKGQVFTAGADGSLRTWAITSRGELEAGPVVEKAHEGRVAACVVHEGRVFTASYDGSVKCWSARTLALLAEARGAHQGDKVHCLAVGPNGVLFTGGDDKFVRAWDPALRPVGSPLEGHGSAVRVLAAGRRGLLVSGDAEGDVCIWETFPVDLPPLPSDASDPLLASSSNGAGPAPTGAAAGAEGPGGEACPLEVAVGHEAMAQLESMLTARPEAAAAEHLAQAAEAGVPMPGPGFVAANVHGEVPEGLLEAVHGDAAAVTVHAKITAGYGHNGHVTHAPVMPTGYDVVAPEPVPVEANGHASYDAGHVYATAAAVGSANGHIVAAAINGHATEAAEYAFADGAHVHASVVQSASHVDASFAAAGVAEAAAMAAAHLQSAEAFAPHVAEAEVHEVLPASIETVMTAAPAAVAAVVGSPAAVPEALEALAPAAAEAAAGAAAAPEVLEAPAPAPAPAPARTLEVESVAAAVAAAVFVKEAEARSAAKAAAAPAAEPAVFAAAPAPVPAPVAPPPQPAAPQTQADVEPWAVPPPPPQAQAAPPMPQTQADIEPWAVPPQPQPVPQPLVAEMPPQHSVTGEVWAAVQEGAAQASSEAAAPASA
ncbi:hypothetical protein HYH03_012084 [Edaphochlamys debaryana]|uniref:Uncharacterized protein n=1 Tax=Edaphochlamys debaryana TaxID=47281 RepID=A0A836BVV3_9CHLO|nr:hypothetical protein HYH03_012084 [Edaphochlamys debaryana]|eukprot:KAG2489448.1 hypothetical protein HYH03_012084 [Edaphochlamys debaryana]